MAGEWSKLGKLREAANRLYDHAQRYQPYDHVLAAPIYNEAAAVRWAHDAIRQQRRTIEELRAAMKAHRIDAVLAKLRE